MANVLGVIRKAFPFIAAAASVGGPLGTIAASVVGKALGVDKTPNGTPEAIADAIAGATPDQMAALKQAEIELQGKLAELGFQQVEQLESIAEEDRASARAREVAVKDWTPRLLAAGVVLLAAFGEGYVLIHGTPAHVAGELVGRILGTLDSAVMLVLSYYFGSSAGSDRKTEILANGNSAGSK